MCLFTCGHRESLRANVFILDLTKRILVWDLPGEGYVVVQIRGSDRSTDDQKHHSENVGMIQNNWTKFNVALL